MASNFAQMYKRDNKQLGFLTPLQMLEKMIEEAMSFDMADNKPYMRFLIRIHGSNGIVSETMALMEIARKDFSWNLKGFVKDRPTGSYPYDNRYFYDGYDGIEIVGRVSYEDESWQDWLD